jgi:hypothetical protein
MSCGALFAFFLLGCCIMSGIGIAFRNAGRGDGRGDGGLFQVEALRNGEALEVTANEINEAYRANGVAADEKYKGKRVQITGVFLRTENVGNRRICVAVSAQGGRFDCYFDDNHKGELAKLSNGKILAVRGVFIGFGQGGLAAGIEIERCELVEAKPVSLKLSASQFQRERFGDSELFEARYKDKTLQITGKVADKLYEFGNSPIGLSLDCETQPWPPGRLLCYFTDSQKLEKISKGQIITFRAIYSPRPGSGEFTFRNCELLK